MYKIIYLIFAKLEWFCKDKKEKYVIKYRKRKYEKEVVNNDKNIKK